MKNIHLIETKIGQRITKTSKGKFLWCPVGATNFVEIRRGYLGFHLYITSSEEIKQGDWFLPIGRGTIHKCTAIFENNLIDYCWDGREKVEIIKSACEKIILTTDPVLIADSIQAIDDEFLHWFVENTSCEEVEVKSKEYDYRYGGKQTLVYKIIIPKEEVELKIPAKFCIPHKHYISDDDKICYETGYKDGMNYQAERMYSEEEAIKKIIDYVDFQFNANGELDSEIKKWFNAFKKK